jgi:hypothetical protein
MDKEKLFDSILNEAQIAMRTPWDIREPSGEWRGLNVQDSEGIQKMVGYVASHPGLSCGPNAGPGASMKSALGR